MSRLPRFGTALSALALVSVLAGCASPMSRQAHRASFDKSDVGLAMRAQFALASGDFENAIGLAERAVENQPNEAATRALLGNVYFGSGRFASAEAAYRDTLTLVANEPTIVLKLALVQIAQGKNEEALAFLNAASKVLDPADYGLAVALAGRPGEAVAVLEPAARRTGADARVRQNLALAYGLSGDWMAARTIAAQDLPADQVDSRVRQWMALARPARASDQVAALTGVKPAAADPGQPVRLALRDEQVQLARLVPSAPAPQPVNAVPAPEAAMAPLSLDAAPAPAPAMAMAPQPVEELAPVLPEYEAPAMAAAFEAPAAAEVVAQAAAAPVAAEKAPPPPLVAALGPQVEPAPKSKKAVAKAKAPKVRDGSAGVVVQLGAYSSPARVEAAWESIAGRYNSLRQYMPTSARFDSGDGTVYRLSVKGFDSLGEANSLCSSLKSKGKSCFVRNVAGDSPVRFASR